MKAPATIAAVLLLCLIAVPAAIAQSHGEHGEHQQMTVESPEFEQAMAEHSLPTLTWLPRRGMLIALPAENGKLVRMIEAPGSPARRFPGFAKPLFSLAVNPDPAANGMLFTQSETGDGEPQVFVLDLSAGSRLRVSDGKAKNGAAIWSPDGGQIAYSTSRRNGVDWDIVVGDAKGDESIPLLEREGRWLALDWSPDGSHLLVGRFLAPGRYHPFLLEVAARRLVPLYDAEDPVTYRAAVFATDGRGIYYLSDDVDGAPRLRHRGIENADSRPITEDVGSDVTLFDLLPEANLVAFVTDEEGNSALRLLDITSGDQSSVETPEGTIRQVRFSPDGRSLGLVVERADSGTGVFGLDVESGEIVQWLDPIEPANDPHSHADHAHHAHGD